MKTLEEIAKVYTDKQHEENRSGNPWNIYANMLAALSEAVAQERAALRKVLDGMRGWSDSPVHRWLEAQENGGYCCEPWIDHGYHASDCALQTVNRFPTRHV